MKRMIVSVFVAFVFYTANAQTTTQTAIKLTGTDQVGFALPLQIDDNPTGLTFNSNTWGRQIRLSRLDNTYHYDIGLDNSNEFYIMKRNSFDVAFKIAGNGNIGIGTTTPQGKLDVKGNVYLNRPSGIIDQTSVIGIPGGGYFAFAPSDMSASNNSYMLFSFPTSTTFRIGTDYDGNINQGTLRDIELGTHFGAPTLTVKREGNVGIGTTAPGNFKLAVEGKIGAREVKVTLASWADYVFHKDYNLMNLANLEAFIQKNKHLPNIPSAAEVKDNGGVELGEMNRKLLEKIEELTLHVIEMNKNVQRLNKEVEQLKKENEALKK